MQVRLVMGAVVGALMILVSAQPAAAQGTKVDFAGGYQFLRFLEEGGLNIPQGWGASIAVGNNVFKVVGDIGGHYIEGENVHTFQGGIEVAGTQKRVVPFVRGLAGLGHFSGGTNVFVFTPEVGVKFMGNDRVGAQVAVGFPVFMNSDFTESSLRVFAGIVIRK